MRGDSHTHCAETGQMSRWSSLQTNPQCPNGQALNAKRGVRRTQLLRFVANASGGLSEALAERMHAGFGCCVLPCYGMTECMPVSSPPLVHPVLHPASSGQVVGPYVRVMGGDGEVSALSLS